MAKVTDKQLRLFILDYFDEEEFHTFCFDYFRDVRHEFGSGMSFNEKVMELIDYCRRNGVRVNFIEALKLEKVRPFNTFFDATEEKSTALPPSYEPEQRNPQKIFVSHSSEDGKLAQQIAQDLQRNGYDIFITPTSIRAGEKWVDAIMRGLDECGIFLVLLTPNAIQSGWVKRETNTAIALNNGNKARLLFLHVEECEPPTLWQQWQYLSFRNQDYQANFANLLRELKGEPALAPAVDLSELQPAPGAQPEPSSQPDDDQPEEAQAESLYEQLLQAQADADWLNVVILAAKIEMLAPDFRDVATIKESAVQRLQKPKPEPPVAEVAVEQILKEAAEEERCKGVTKSGQPCRNKPLPDSEYCNAHAQKTKSKSKQQGVAKSSVPEGKKQASAATPVINEQALLKILGQFKDTAGYHLYPDISQDDQSKIRNRLELLPKKEEILAYIVATMWGGVHAGLAFTPKRVVWRNDRFMSALSDYSLHGELLYDAFSGVEFSKKASWEIYLGEGLGFNHSGWCELTTEQILGLLDEIKKLASG